MFHYGTCFAEGSDTEDTVKGEARKQRSKYIIIIM